MKCPPPLPAVLTALLTASLAALGSACDSSGGLGLGGGLGPSSVPPAIRIEPNIDLGLAVGETLPLTATYLDASGAPVAGVVFEWRSSNAAVAEVNASGVVRALGVGVVWITGRARGVADSAMVSVRPPGLVFTEVSVGSRPCSVAVGGTAYCWLKSPIAVPGGHAFTALSAGWLRHSCALELGRAYCWGENDYGELGSTPVAIRRTPTAVSGGRSFAMVGAGVQFSCGLTTSGAAYCWGRNDYGQLGTGSVNGPTRCIGTACSPIPVAVTGGLVFRSLSVGAHHVCGLVASGAAYCWGVNTLGTLGDGTFTDRSRPIPVTGGLTFAAISAGSWHTCAVTTDGAVYCWGSDTRGLLGTQVSTLERCVDNQPCSSRPVRAVEEMTLTAVSAGGYHTCGSGAGGIAICWGAYYEGGGFGTRVAAPVTVVEELRFSSVSAGIDDACGLTIGRTVYCWRSGDAAEDRLRARSIVPRKVEGQL